MWLYKFQITTTRIIYKFSPISDLTTSIFHQFLTEPFLFFTNFWFHCLLFIHNWPNQSYCLLIFDLTTIIFHHFWFHCLFLIYYWPCHSYFSPTCTYISYLTPYFSPISDHTTHSFHQFLISPLLFFTIIFLISPLLFFTYFWSHYSYFHQFLISTLIFYQFLISPLFFSPISDLITLIFINLNLTTIRG